MNSWHTLKMNKNTVHLKTFKKKLPDCNISTLGQTAWAISYKNLWQFCSVNKQINGSLLSQKSPMESRTSPFHNMVSKNYLKKVQLFITSSHNYKTWDSSVGLSSSFFNIKERAAIVSWMYKASSFSSFIYLFLL